MAWGYGTTVEDTEVYEGQPDDPGLTVDVMNEGQITQDPIPETYRHHTPGVTGGLGPVPSASSNISFYLEDDYDMPVEEGNYPVVEDQTGETQARQGLFDFFSHGYLSGETPYGQFQMNAPQGLLGFEFNQMPSALRQKLNPVYDLLGEKTQISPFINVGPGRGMIGVRGTF